MQAAVISTRYKIMLYRLFPYLLRSLEYPTIATLSTDGKDIQAAVPHRLDVQATALSCRDNRIPYRLLVYLLGSVEYHTGCYL
jgi:hypothetical protein